MRESSFNTNVKEGWETLPRFDKEKYVERDGLEGPIQTRAGKVIYYDPTEGEYYDPDSDVYMTPEDIRALDRPDVPLRNEDTETTQDFSAGGDYVFGKDKASDTFFVTYKGKVISTGDFDTGADAWFMAMPGSKGQISFNTPEEVISHFTKNNITGGHFDEEQVMKTEADMPDPDQSKVMDVLSDLKDIYAKMEGIDMFRNGSRRTELEDMYMDTVTNWFYPSQRHGITDIKGAKVGWSRDHD